MIRFILFLVLMFSAVTVLSAADPEPLRIATFNIRGPKKKPPNDQESRKPRIRKIIEDNNFHIFGVQEAFRKEQTDPIEAIPGYARIDGGSKVFRNLGRKDSIFYRTDRLELLSQGIFMLSEKPDTPGSRGWDGSEARLAVWGRFRDKITGKVFYLYNTHLDHVGKLAKLNGSAMIVAHIKKNAPDQPVFLIGDFNSTDKSQVYNNVCTDMKDARKISESAPTGPEVTFHGFGGKKKWLLDYIFVSSGIRILSHRVIDTQYDGCYPSDHYPVMAEIILE